jgi:hypothetical protein
MQVRAGRGIGDARRQLTTRAPAVYSHEKAPPVGGASPYWIARQGANLDARRHVARRRRVGPDVRAPALFGGRIICAIACRSGFLASGCSSQFGRTSAPNHATLMARLPASVITNCVMRASCRLLSRFGVWRSRNRQRRAPPYPSDSHTARATRSRYIHMVLLQAFAARGVVRSSGQDSARQSTSSESGRAYRSIRDHEMICANISPRSAHPGRRSGACSPGPLACCRKWQRQPSI